MAEKISHEEARYARYGDETEHCGNCSMWRDREKERCTLVVDPIEWHGWCRHWDAKK